MTDYKIGSHEIENIGLAAQKDDRPKEVVFAELGVDPDALREECLSYARTALTPQMAKMAEEMTGQKITTADLIAGAVGVGFELGFRAAQVLAGLGE